MNLFLSPSSFIHFFIRKTAYTRKRARQLHVDVRPSTDPKKKIDVFNKKGKKVASVGARGMMDFPTYKKERGMAFAKTRRRLYKIRHNKDRFRKGTPGYYADKLLW
jgi:hypothetical protein